MIKVQIVIPKRNKNILALTKIIRKIEDFRVDLKY